MKSRITQLLSRYIGMGLVALAGIIGLDDSGGLDVHATSIATGLVGVGGMLLDLYIHRKRES